MIFRKLPEEFVQHYSDADWRRISYFNISNIVFVHTYDGQTRVRFPGLDSFIVRCSPEQFVLWATAQKYEELDKKKTDLT